MSRASGLLASVPVPVLGLYGADCARVSATIAPADSAIKVRDKSFQPHMFASVGHGFLRQPNGKEDANLRATEQAWPLTPAFFRRHLRG